MKEELILRMLDHFHEESDAFGGWSIFVTTIEEALIINEEFKGVLKAKENINKTFTVVRLKDSQFKKRHTILVLREKAKMYQEEANKYYLGMKKLLGE